MTYTELETLILDDYRVNRRRSLRTLESARLPHLRAFFKTRPIDASTIRAYIRARLDAHAAPASINRELAALRRMHTLAALPWPRVSALREAPPREGFVTAAVFDRIRTELPPHLRDFVAFLYLSSWRVGEARTLTWSAVHFETSRKHFGPTRQAKAIISSSPPRTRNPVIPAFYPCAASYARSSSEPSPRVLLIPIWCSITGHAPGRSPTSAAHGTPHAPAPVRPACLSTTYAAAPSAISSAPASASRSRWRCPGIAPAPFSTATTSPTRPTSSPPWRLSAREPQSGVKAP